MENKYSIELTGNISGQKFTANSDEAAIKKAKELCGNHSIRFIFRVENNKEITIWSNR